MFRKGDKVSYYDFSRDCNFNLIIIGELGGGMYEVSFPDDDEVYRISETVLRKGWTDGGLVSI
jgi:hypothetical protein